ncbi:hypothetical protein [Porphyrobacter sp. LM 6]|uniref:hypothetical protein n=1 Tax=Porphyrobacter sp. LM 6 TaxID=1896196 RepID=UPI000863962F|nr:hypothetical protein [Porphyrobacter sp. LM 6]AOL93130.1 hypothetical protein BG023_11173 [Porphyrobacter sp. LM 6]
MPNPGHPDECATHTNRHWRVRFLDCLAESSNVAKSARHANISVSRAYKLRRADPEFAGQWLAALAEGYLHLEMEVARNRRPEAAHDRKRCRCRSPRYSESTDANPTRTRHSGKYGKLAEARAF